MSTSHQPKGSMCTTCTNGSEACAALPFEAMQVIKTYPDGVKAVKCSSHEPAAPAEVTPPLQCLGCGAWNHKLPDGSLPCGH